MRCTQHDLFHSSGPKYYVDLTNSPWAGGALPGIRDSRYDLNLAFAAATHVGYSVKAKLSEVVQVSTFGLLTSMALECLSNALGLALGRSTGLEYLSHCIRILHVGFTTLGELQVASGLFMSNS